MLCYDTASNILQQLVCYRKAINGQMCWSVQNCSGSMSHCWRELSIRTENQTVNRSVVGNWTDLVACFLHKHFDSICHMFGLFSPHLQVSVIWVNLVSRTGQKIPKCCCCCWTETTMSASQGNICTLTLTISKLTTSWLRKPHYGPERKVIQQKRFKSRSCWLSQSPGIVKNTCWEKIQCD